MKGKTISNMILWVLGAYLLLPLIATFLYSVFKEWDSILPSGVTLKYYGEILSDGTFLAAIVRTVLISVLPIILCTLMILLTMYVITVYVPWLDRYMQILCTIPYAIQGIIIAISVLALYADAPWPFSNRIFMLTATYCVIILPYMYQGIRNRLNGINAVKLLEAAQMLGTTKLHAFFAVVVPNIVSGVMISAMLSASLIFGDFVIVNIIGGSYYPTTQGYLYHVLSQSGQKSSAVIIVLFAVTLLLTLGSLRMKDGKRKVKHKEAA